jgi:hypothetical protein
MQTYAQGCLSNYPLRTVQEGNRTTLDWEGVRKRGSGELDALVAILERKDGVFFFLWLPAVLPGVCSGWMLLANRLH